MALKESTRTPTSSDAGDVDLFESVSLGHPLGRSGDGQQRFGETAREIQADPDGGEEQQEGDGEEHQDGGGGDRALDLFHFLKLGVCGDRVFEVEEEFARQHGADHHPPVVTDRVPGAHQ